MMYESMTQIMHSLVPSEAPIIWARLPFLQLGRIGIKSHSDIVLDWIDSWQQVCTIANYLVFGGDPEDELNNRGEEMDHVLQNINSFYHRFLVQSN